MVSFCFWFSCIVAYRNLATISKTKCIYIFNKVEWGSKENEDSRRFSYAFKFIFRSHKLLNVFVFLLFLIL